MGRLSDVQSSKIAARCSFIANCMIARRSFIANEGGANGR
jgi:hypothetical protein